MLYQLSDGRTVEISVYEYLSCTDEELNSLIGSNYGMEINNPNYGSIITKPGRPEPDHVDEYREVDIPDIPDEEKFDDQDYIDED